MFQTIFSLLIAITFLTAGCATTQKNNNETRPLETKEDVQSAVGSVVSTIKGDAVRVMYCPKCGKHYSAKLEVCPADQTPLKEVEE